MGAGGMRKTFACEGSVELRKANRYRVSAPARFLWAPEGGPTSGGRGVIRDINASGVFVVTSSLPPAGARVQLEILLPQMENNEPGLHLHGEGAVVRVDCGFAGARGCILDGFAASVHLSLESSNAVNSRLESSVHLV